mgnify:CR=1 FL=1
MRQSADEVGPGKADRRGIAQRMDVNRLGPGKPFVENDLYFAFAIVDRRERRDRTRRDAEQAFHVFRLAEAQLLCPDHRRERLEIDAHGMIDRDEEIPARAVFQEQVLGMPTEYATDYSVNTLTLNFRAEVEDTLRLIVRRLPLTDLIGDKDVPPQFVNGLVQLAKQLREVDTPTKKGSILSLLEPVIRKAWDEVVRNEIKITQNKSKKEYGFT